jgi:hypothetical protein
MCPPGLAGSASGAVRDKRGGRLRGVTVGAARLGWLGHQDVADSVADGRMSDGRRRIHAESERAAEPEAKHLPLSERCMHAENPEKNKQCR